MGTPGKRVWVFKLTAGSNPVLSARKYNKYNKYNKFDIFNNLYVKSLSAKF